MTFWIANLNLLIIKRNMAKACSNWITNAINVLALVASISRDVTIPWAWGAQAPPPNGVAAPPKLGRKSVFFALLFWTPCCVIKNASDMDMSAVIWVRIRMHSPIWWLASRLRYPYNYSGDLNFVWAARTFSSMKLLKNWLRNRTGDWATFSRCTSVKNYAHVN